MPRAPNYNKPLPNCEGPKLGPFKDREATIDFRRLLSDGDSVSGGHAHVFEVCIKSVVYVLKVFKFYDHSEDEAELLEREKKTITPSLLHAHKDPFYNECRAYGRISEAGLNGEIAARCFGFLILPAAKETYFEQKFQIATWDRPDEDYGKPIAQRMPFRAIVKELVKTEVEFTRKDAYKMLRHLKRLAGLGVWPIDVCARNYRAGLLIDFSAALTEPHYFFDTREPWQVDSEKREGFLAFDDMIQEAGMELSIYRAFPNGKYVQKLRHPPVRPEAFLW